MVVKIGFDAGHGLPTPARRTWKKFHPKVWQEWELNNRIANYAEEGLKEYEGVEVIRLDDRTGRTDIPLGTRVRTANNAKIDRLMSFHTDAGINGGRGGGISVHRARGSSKTTEKYQRDIYNELIKLTGLKGNRASPLAINNFYIVRNVKAPAVLVEHGFMDSATDVPIIVTEDFARKAAQAHVNVLVRDFNLKKKVSKDKGYYIKGDSGEGVTQLQADLKALGYSVDVRGGFGPQVEQAVKEFQKDNKLSVDGSAGPATLSKINHLLEIKEDVAELYKVQVGAYSQKDNANKKLEELKDKGIDGYIKKE